MKSKIDVLTAEEIYENFRTLVKLVTDHFEGERQEKVLSIINHFKERIIEAPASSREDYHNAFTGGWLHHTLHVVRIAMQLLAIWESELSADDITEEELVLVAIFHDWGKLGTIDEPYYVRQTSSWHIGKGILYNINPDRKRYVAPPISALITLQHFGIQLTEVEYISILISDGPYIDSNKPYFSQTDSGLPLIIHHADHISSTIEKLDFLKRN